MRTSLVLAVLAILAALAPAGCSKPAPSRSAPETAAAPAAHPAAKADAAAPAPRATPPDFSRVSQPLCASFHLSKADCARTSFAKPISIEIDADPDPEWIYVSTRGGDALCHVRNACFAIVDERGGGWQVVLSAMGTEVGVAGGAAGKVERDLVVGASDSAEEATVTLWSWRAGRYQSVRRTTCVHGDPKPADEVCRALEGARPIL